MKPPLISIVIPSYNKEKYIQKTLNSIFNQTYKNFEVVIQDGGSTDRTVLLIKQFVKKYPKQIKFESKKDNGQLDAINKGMKKVKGDVFAFINADDMYEAGAFESVANYCLENPKALWFAGKGTVVDEKDSEIAKIVTLYKNFLFKLNSRMCLLVTNYLMQPSVFVSKKAYEKYGPFTGTKNFVMEYDLWLKISKSNMPVLINKNLTKFRIEKTTKTKTMLSDILIEDQQIVRKYTSNKMLLFLHEFHNWARVFIGRFV